MSIELLYTSAPKGLKRGSRGFCTVLSTMRTPINLTSRLEALSGYRQIYPPESPQASLNPVAYSHLRIVVAGQTHSVLSRVAAYGSDYTGRTNKIAHHVVPGVDEYGIAGPAWVMMQPSVMRTIWSGQCETPERGPIIPKGDQQSGACGLWQRVAGDAGWGGVIADAFLQQHAAPTWIIYRADQQSFILPLLNEAIALLPLEKRWEATFSTYATNIPPNVDCKVRCTVEGTEEARFALVKPGVIDLTKPLPPAAENLLTQQARGVRTAVPELPKVEEPDQEVSRQEEEDDSGKPAVVEINLDEEPDVPRPPLPEMPMHGHGSSMPPPIEPPELPTISKTGSKEKVNLWMPLLALLFLTLVGTATWMIANQIVGPPEQVALPEIPDPIQIDDRDDPPVDPSVDSSPETDEEPQTETLNHDSATGVEPVAIELTLHYRPTQLTQAIENVRAGKDPLSDQLIAMGSAPTKLAQMPALAGWQEKPQKLKEAIEISLVERVDVQTSVGRERDVTVRPIDDLPSFSGAKLRSFIDQNNLDLIVSISIDTRRKFSLFSDQVEAIKKCAESTVALRANVSSIAALSGQLPDGTRKRVTRFLQSVPTLDSQLIDSLRDPDSPDSCWTIGRQVHTLIGQLAKDGGPKTWKEEQRAKLLEVSQLLESMTKNRDELLESLSVLQKGQDLNVPDVFFYDAAKQVVAAYEIRLVVSW